MLSGEHRERAERMFRAYGAGVGGYVLARVRDAELAEAITSGVFLIVVERIGQCRSSEAGWLWSIVRSEIARHFRDRRDHDPLDEAVADGAMSPPERIARDEMQAHLAEAMRNLSEEQQELIGMKFFLDMSNLDIAAATGKTASNVGVMLHRAVKQLRSLMQRVEAEP